MVADSMNPEVLVSLNNEMEAWAIVSALHAHGIRAETTGNYTAGFQAEAPGTVSVVVGRADIARARQVLQETCREFAEIDWSTIDVGDDHPSLGPEDRPKETNPQKKSGSFQFSIRSLLILQAVVSVVLSLWKGLHTTLFSVFVVAATIFILTLTGTVAVASNLERARQAWTYTGRALLVGLLVLGLILLMAEIL